MLKYFVLDTLNEQKISVNSSFILSICHLQRNGAWAIRNMVSRSREQCPAFLTLGTEELLHEAIVAYADIEYDLKSALRDLGCDVKLKEEWTGVKNKLNISPNKRMD